MTFETSIVEVWAWCIFQRLLFSRTILEFLHILVQFLLWLVLLTRNFHFSIRARMDTRTPINIRESLTILGRTKETDRVCILELARFTQKND